MAAERVADMSKQELRVFIEGIVDERINSRTRPYPQSSDRPISEMLESMRKNIIVSKPGDPGIVEMIRADRDR